VEEAGADENRADPDGRTPLMCAVSKSHADVVKYLRATISRREHQVIVVLLSCTMYAVTI
jgi:hypothetical protein